MRHAQNIGKEIELLYLQVLTVILLYVPNRIESH